MPNNDLISRSALLAEYDRVHVGASGGARKLMEDASAVDAVEVVHARWIFPDFADLDDEHHYCSACNRRALFYEDFAPEFSEPDESIEDVHCLGCRSLGIVEFLTPYCPNCGTKMDGEGRGRD